MIYLFGTFKKAYKENAHFGVLENAWKLVLKIQLFMKPEPDLVGQQGLTRKINTHTFHELNLVGKCNYVFPSGRKTNAGPETQFFPKLSGFYFFAP